MGVGGIGHLAEAEVDAFGQKHVEQADPVLAGRAGAQVDEGVREADGIVDLHQEIGDARLREALVEIKDELVGTFRGLDLGEPVDVQAVVTDDAARDGAGSSCLGEFLQPKCHPCLPVGEPFAGIERHGQCSTAGHDRQRNQCSCRVAVTPGARQPEVAGAEAVSAAVVKVPKAAFYSGLRSYVWPCGVSYSAVIYLLRIVRIVMRKPL